MWPIADLDDNNLRVADTFDGLLAYLIWDPMHSVFGDKVKRAFKAIHVSSGGSMVVLAGSSDWISKKERQQFARDVRRDEGYAGFALAATSGGEMQLFKSLKSLSAKFNLKAKDLPALVFVTEASGLETYAFGIDRELVSRSNDAVEQELLELFEIVSEVVSDHPCHISPASAEEDEDAKAELIQWRARRMEMLVPILKARKTLRFMKNHSGKLVSGSRLLAPVLAAL